MRILDTENCLMFTENCLMFEDTPVCVFERLTSPWFVSMDICRALGLRGDYPSSRILITEAGEVVDVLSLEGVMALISRSGTPTAHRLYQWVYDEVLPMMRGVAPGAVDEVALEDASGYSDADGESDEQSKLVEMVEGYLGDGIPIRAAAGRPDPGQPDRHGRDGGHAADAPPSRQLPDVDRAEHH